MDGTRPYSIGSARTPSSLAQLNTLGDMRIAYDAEADAAYIYLADIEPGGAKATVTVETGEAAAGDWTAWTRT